MAGNHHEPPDLYIHIYLYIQCMYIYIYLYIYIYSVYIYIPSISSPCWSRALAMFLFFAAQVVSKSEPKGAVAPCGLPPDPWVPQGEKPGV